MMCWARLDDFYLIFGSDWVLRVYPLVLVGVWEERAAVLGLTRLSVGCQCLYVMTADTARYPAPPGINSTSPPDTRGLTNNITRQEAEVKRNTSSHHFSHFTLALTERCESVDYWWSLVADRSLSSSVVWWYRHWSYEQLQLSQTTLRWELTRTNTAGPALLYQHCNHQQTQPDSQLQSQPSSLPATSFVFTFQTVGSNKAKPASVSVIIIVSPAMFTSLVCWWQWLRTPGFPSPLSSPPLSPHSKSPCLWWAVLWASAVVFKLSDLVRQSNTDMINGPPRNSRDAQYPPPSVWPCWADVPLQSPANIQHLWRCVLVLVVVVVVVVEGEGLDLLDNLSIKLAGKCRWWQFKGEGRQETSSDDELCVSVTRPVSSQSQTVT